MKRITVLFILFTISILMNLYVTANLNTIGSAGQISVQSNIYLQPGDSYIINMSRVANGKITYSSNISYEVMAESNYNGQNAYCIKIWNRELFSTSVMDTQCVYFSVDQYEDLGYKGYYEFGNNITQYYDLKIDYNQTTTENNFLLPYSDGNFTQKVSTKYYSVVTWNISSENIGGESENYLAINTTSFSKKVVTSEYKNTDIGNFSSWKITSYPLNSTTVYELIYQNGTISHGINSTTNFLNNFTAEINTNGSISYAPMDQIYNYIATFWISKDYHIKIAEQDKDSQGNLTFESRIVKLTILPKTTPQSTTLSSNPSLSSTNTIDSLGSTPPSSTNTSNTSTAPSFLLMGAFLSLMILSKIRKKE